MSKDISSILEGWDYEPDEIQVRIAAGNDGREKIQLRVDLGVLQMELHGRPDGTRPEGFESYLDFYLERQRMHEAAHPDSPSFVLSDEDCLHLWREGVQYYHRYLSLWHLQRYDLCVRDTERNLRLFAFVKQYAQGDRNKLQFDQWRPYVTMIHTRALAAPLVDEGEYGQALRAIDRGIDAIRDFLDEYNQSDRAEQSAELANLERWRAEVATKSEEVLSKTPEGKVLRLRRQLHEAVADEHFEEAARLRDEIRRLSDDEGLAARA